MGDISSTFYNPATLSGLTSGGISLSFETDHYSSYAEFLEKINQFMERILHFLPFQPIRVV